MAGLDIMGKAALNEGMSNYVFVVYRHAVATIFIAPFALVLDKKSKSKMTLSIFAKVLLLGFLEPVADQNLYFLGMKYTSATFAAAMVNVLPTISFILACLLRLENLKLSSKHSQAKIVGTLATVGGAMIMTLVRGPKIPLPWTKEVGIQAHRQGEINDQHSVKGALMIIIGCFSWSCFMILQVITLRTYPAELSLTAWICLVATLEGSIVALVMEKNMKAWYIKWDTELLSAVYGGILCTGMTYYIQGVALKERGPVFVTAFSPVCMILVAILSSLFLGEQMYLGRIIGAIVIIMGLYMVVWGKMKDYKSSYIEEKEIPQVNQSEEANNERATTTIDEGIICEK
ncbi:hypothetical protein ACS0TY_015991 [Phlomoides rotata]